LDAVLQAPPPYEEHVLDQPYKDRPLLVASMPQSGTSTPIYDCPRSLSCDNLARPHAVANLRGVRPADLSERLQSLRTANRTFSRFLRAASGTRAFRQNDSSYDSYIGSATGDHPALENIDYHDLNDLSRVPPYSAAIRAPVPSAYYHETLPNYDAAEVPEDQT
jgi:hypothetical protein